MRPLKHISPRFVFMLVFASYLVTAARGANSFTPTSSLGYPRYEHTATLLPNGKVLVAAGHYYVYSEDAGYIDVPLSSAELYDPTTGTWSPTGSLTGQRESHTATLLPNGKVLVAGGILRGGYTITLASAELYDPATGTWTSTGNIGPSRYGHSATLLPNGKVLIAGGDGDFGSLHTAELYNPATGVWSSTGSLANYRSGHTATLLPNGKVLVAGGDTNTIELYNPATGTWTDTGRLGTVRYSHTATLLPHGKVLVAGGGFFQNGSGMIAFASAELYDPATGTWTNTGNLNYPRYGHTAALLPNGKVLVAGGNNPNGNLSSAELYDPATGNWSSAGDLEIQRYLHTATSLADGKVLFAGGVSPGAFLSSAELYVPAPPSLNPIINPIKLGDGSFQFHFNGNPNATNYSVLASLNVAAPFNTWSNLGHATETSTASGQFQFTDHQAPSYPRRFYSVSSP